MSSDPISFLGGVDPVTGLIVERGHVLFGQSVSKRVLVFPYGKGSTVGTYVIYQLSKAGTAPCAIINRVTEPIVAVGAIMAGIPLVDKLNEDPIESIPQGATVEVDGTSGTVEVV